MAAIVENGERAQPCLAPALPAALADLAADRRWWRDRVGESGSAVYRIAGGGGPDLYLKHGVGPVAAAVLDETVRLRWLADHVPVPRVVRAYQDPDAAWLVTEALPGETAYQRLAADPAGRPALVDALAAFLRRIHAIPRDACPFVADHRLRLRQARTRMAARLVEEEDFDDARAGWSAEQVWTAMQALLPLAPDPVVTHGDASLDNLLVVDGQVTGCIDCGLAGVADRYQDLAILGSCLAEFDAGLEERLFAAYGIAVPDRRKLDFHRMLDEMF